MTDLTIYLCGAVSGIGVSLLIQTALSYRRQAPTAPPPVVRFETTVTGQARGEIRPIPFTRPGTKGFDAQQKWLRDMVSK